jgi:hypothetical protein
MKQSQSNLHLGTLDVLKLTYQRGVMTGWQIGALREFFKGFSKFFGISLANSIIPKEIEVSDNTKVNTLASAACKGAFTAVIEGPIGTLFNGWITFNITSEKNASYLSHLKTKGNNTLYGMCKEALRGNVLTSSRQVFSNSFIIGSTEVLKEPLSEKFKEYNKEAQKLIVGGCIGVLTAIVIAPTETVLTQLLRAGERERNASSALRNVFCNHGITALYTGLLQKMALVTAGSAITSIFQQYTAQFSESQKTENARE